VFSALLAAATVTAGSVTVAGTPAHAASDTGVQGYGSAVVVGAPGVVNKPLISMAADPDGRGYWLVAADGGIFAYDAPFFGSTGALTLNAPVVDMAPTPSGRGYWMVATDGGVFAYGDAGFHGSMGGRPLNKPIVAIASSPTGMGYWMIGSDGGIFAFGDARFWGSLPGSAITATAVDIVTRPQGDGYWIVDDRGGVHAFGSAPFVGSLPAQGINPTGRVIAGAATPTGQGYWLSNSEGGVYTFGDAPFLGAGTVPTGQRIAAFAAATDGRGYWTASTSGLLPARPGDRGDAVTAIQNRLWGLGYWLPGVDGAYGGGTAQAVMAFQKYEGLPRTGVADETTVAAMGSASPPRARSTSGDVIEIDKPRQLLYVVRGGRTVHTMNASTGSEVPYVERSPDGRILTGDSITYDGRYRTNRELPDGWRQSDLGLLWRPKYFNNGIAVHGSGSVPALPASHGCVRVSIAAMNFIWAADLMPIGMPVWVYSS
jgi:peptidoglycan hydrolase-like protein with peptidoglycan-binding domain